MAILDVARLGYDGEPDYPAFVDESLTLIQNENGIDYFTMENNLENILENIFIENYLPNKISLGVFLDNLTNTYIEIVLNKFKEFLNEKFNNELNFENGINSQTSFFYAKYGGAIVINSDDDITDNYYAFKKAYEKGEQAIDDYIENLEY